MRFNEHELVSLLQSKTPDWEGRLSYKPPKSGVSRNQYKERYFKVLGNLLFCLRTANTSEKVTATDIVSALVLEQCRIQEESLVPEHVHSFSVIFVHEELLEEKHIFVADSPRSVVQWIEALRSASFETQREQLILLQIKLRNKTGVDPLRGTALQFNPVYCLQGSGEVKPPDFSRLCSIGMERSHSDGAVNLPKPLPRKPKKNGGLSKSSNFVSHLGIENWDRLDEADVRSVSPEGVGKSKPTFKSHVPEGNLIDF